MPLGDYLTLENTKKAVSVVGAVIGAAMFIQSRMLDSEDAVVEPGVLEACSFACNLASWGLSLVVPSSDRNMAHEAALTTNLIAQGSKVLTGGHALPDVLDLAQKGIRYSESAMRTPGRLKKGVEYGGKAVNYVKTLVSSEKEPSEKVPLTPEARKKRIREMQKKRAFGQKRRIRSQADYQASKRREKAKTRSGGGSVAPRRRVK